LAVQFLLVTGYYVAQAVAGLPLSGSTVAGWLVAGTVAGVVFGTAGSWWRAADGWRAIAGSALVSGVFVAEGCLRAMRFPWQGASGATMIVAGLLAALVLGRTWRGRLVAVALLVVVVPVGWAGFELVNQLLAAF
jgi:hypothetical protein